MKTTSESTHVGSIPDFPLLAEGEISKEFRKKNITTFIAAAEWIKHLPYGRNKDKSNLVAVFSENQGTCGTKHALLKKLAIENNFERIELVIALFKMNKVNTPAVAGTLDKHQIQYIPEAHNYLKYEGRILDFTKPDFLPPDFCDFLIEEIKIMPDQIAEYKVEYHKKFLTDWLQREELKLSLDELWSIREQCIADLANNG